MKVKGSVLNLNNKKENVKVVFLLQFFVILAAMVYFSTTKLDLIGDQYQAVSEDTIIMTLLVLSGISGVGSIFVFNEIVELIEKEQDYELQRIEIMQMEEANNLLRSQKHDFSNNLQVLWGMLSLGKHEQAKEYLEDYTNTLKIDEEELEEIKHVNNPYLYTLFMNKSYKCKDLNIEINYSIDPCISLEKFNPIDLIRVFGNLIDNAIYAVKSLEGENRSILVDLYCDSMDYVFCVYNKGPAIPSHIQHRIFEQGFTTKGEEGSGMGLYNVSQLIGKYRGKIRVESDVYRGTQFIINIPKIL